MKRLFIALACLASLAAAPGVLGAQGAISVTPASGATGTRFTITFLTPAAAAQHAYRVHARASGPAARSGNCTSVLSFDNPRPVMGNQHVSFAFRVTADEQLCTGRWTVTVARARRRIAGSGHFTLR